VPELRNADSVAPLPGGLTNTNYKVEAGGRAYVVRISNKDSGLLAIDRQNELHNTIAAADAGVGAPFVAALPEYDAVVLEFLDGRSLSPDDLRRGDLLPLVAQACRRLHGARRFSADFDMFEIQQRYLGVVRERGFRLPDRYLDFEPQVRAIAAAMQVRIEPTVPCNNDLLAENFIDVGGELKLIDYEYSGNNDACFELGNIWSESNLAPRQLDELVTYYYGAPLRNKIARAWLWGLVAKYGWMLWASIQDGVSELEFDFWSWGMEKYERAVAEFDGPDFERRLAEVQRED
jgi:thiamine kinase-like enzyme